MLRAASTNLLRLTRSGRKITNFPSLLETTGTGTLKTVTREPKPTIGNPRLGTREARPGTDAPKLETR